MNDARPQLHKYDIKYLHNLDEAWYRMLVELQSHFVATTHNFWLQKGVRCGLLPLTTGSVSSPMGRGSDSAPVLIEMGGLPTYLADSMQFGLEYLCRLSPCGAYYIMPSFRADKEDETHLSQFFHSEAELPVGFGELTRIVDDYLLTLAEALQPIVGSTSHANVFRGAIPRITFEDAVDRLDGVTDAIKIHKDGWREITRVGEAALLDMSGPALWLTHWDPLAVPFYQARDDDNRALCGDLLLDGVGEVVGAGQRHADGKQVAKALALHRVDRQGYRWYCDLKNERPMLTSGFGLGVERFLMWLTGCADIRNLELFQRRYGCALQP